MSHSISKKRKQSLCHRHANCFFSRLGFCYEALTVEHRQPKGYPQSLDILVYFRNGEEHWKIGVATCRSTVAKFNSATIATKLCKALVEANHYIILFMKCDQVVGKQHHHDQAIILVVFM